jgi:hypothetical protein
MRAALTAILLGGSLSAGCGGGSKSPAGGGSGTDEEFVVGLCQGISKFAASMEKSLAGPTPADFGEAFAQIFKAMVKPTQEFAADFAKLKPPPDLVEWHKKTSQQLSAAAKALKEGKLDDPALEGLSESPIPDMPAAAQQRLAPMAREAAGCKDQNPFEATPSRSSSGSQAAATSALKEAATGTWTGKFGTLTFRPDGTATFVIKNCGTVSPSDAPFGVEDTCKPDTYTGTIDVTAYRYTFKDGASRGTTFQAYVDSGKRLHLGVGTVSAFGPGQKGTVDLFASGSMQVDGSKCTKRSLSNSKDSKAVPCSWSKEQGQNVLEFEDSFGGKDKLVVLEQEGLAVSPNIFVASFERKP